MTVSLICSFCGIGDDLAGVGMNGSICVDCANKFRSIPLSPAISGDDKTCNFCLRKIGTNFSVSSKDGSYTICIEDLDLLKEAALKKRAEG